MNMDIKLAVAQLDPEGLKENPFVDKSKEHEGKVFKMSDAQALMSMANSK